MPREQTTIAPKSKPGEQFADVILPSSEYRSQDFRHAVFANSGCVDASFEACDFSYATFDRAYFNNCTFTRCKFIGARFITSNLHQVTFTDNCRFEYAYFTTTRVPAPQMASSLPGWSNVKHELCQILKANYESIGDREAANEFFALQMQAEKEHKLKAVRRNDSYYSKPKYDSKWPGRLDYRLSYGAHWLSDALWGHGLKPGRLVLLIIALLAILTILIAISPQSIRGVTYDGSVNTLLAGIGQAAFFVSTTFLGLTYELRPATTWACVITIFIGALGYLALGLFVAAIYRRLARH